MNAHKTLKKLQLAMLYGASLQQLDEILSKYFIEYEERKRDVKQIKDVAGQLSLFD